MNTDTELVELQKRVHKAYAITPVEELYEREAKIRRLESENEKLRAFVEEISNTSLSLKYPPIQGDMGQKKLLSIVMGVLREKLKTCWRRYRC